MSDDSYAIDPIGDCIRGITSAESRQAQDRAWDLRCDDICRQSRARNFQAIQDAAKDGFDRLQAGLPNHHLEFTPNPACSFTVRNGDLTGATVTAAMNLNGTVLTVETQRHYSVNDVRPRSVQTVYVKVQENESYYVYERRRVTVTGIALLILKPVMDSLKDGAG